MFVADVGADSVQIQRWIAACERGPEKIVQSPRGEFGVVYQYDQGKQISDFRIELIAEIFD